MDTIYLFQQLESEFKVNDFNHRYSKALDSKSLTILP